MNAHACLSHPISIVNMFRELTDLMSFLIYSFVTPHPLPQTMAEHFFSNVNTCLRAQKYFKLGGSLAQVHISNFRVTYLEFTMQAETNTG